MGKAAKREKARKLKYLARLAATNPKRFQEEWHKRMDSWLWEVRKRAGKLVDEHGKPVPSAFQVVESARELLMKCGIKEEALDEHCSVDVLINECCRTLSHHFDSRLYKINFAFIKK